MTRSEILQISKPILFNTEMVRAILDGRKTVTRRAIRINFRDGEMGYKIVRNTSTGEFCYLEVYDEWESETRRIRSPYMIGDCLYVKETWHVSSVRGENGIYTWTCQYKSDMSEREIHTSDFEKYSAFGRKYFDRSGWIPSIFLPKEAARIFLRVKNVRTERLQEIDNAGALKEGVDGRCCEPADGALSDWQKDYDFSVEKFESVWDSIILPKDRDKYGWAANPYVFVISFERIFENEKM